MGVSIVVDSGCDLKPAEAQRLGIDIVPIVLTIDGRQLRDGIDIDRGQFYTRMRAKQELPGTEPPSAGDFEAAFAKRVNAGNDVVYLALSSGVSKAYENANVAAASFPGRVHVVDSLNGSGGLALMAEYASELAASGRPAAEIASALTPDRLKRAAFFSMPDVTPLGRSGRMPKALVALGSMLNVSLVLKVDDRGGIGPAGQSRSFEKSCEIMVDSLLRAIDRAPNARIAVSHADAAEVAASLRKQIEEKLSGVGPIRTYEAAPSLATNIGAGAAGVFAIVP